MGAWIRAALVVLALIVSQERGSRPATAPDGVPCADSECSKLVAVGRASYVHDALCDSCLHTLRRGSGFTIGTIVAALVIGLFIVLGAVLAWAVPAALRAGGDLSGVIDSVREIVASAEPRSYGFLGFAGAVAVAVTVALESVTARSERLTDDARERPEFSLDRESRLLGTQRAGIFHFVLTSVAAVIIGLYGVGVLLAASLEAAPLEDVRRSWFQITSATLLSIWLLVEAARSFRVAQVARMSNYYTLVADCLRAERRRQRLEKSANRRRGWRVRSGVVVLSVVPVVVMAIVGRSGVDGVVSCIAVTVVTLGILAALPRVAADALIIGTSSQAFVLVIAVSAMGMLGPVTAAGVIGVGDAWTIAFWGVQAYVWAIVGCGHFGRGPGRALSSFTLRAAGDTSEKWRQVILAAARWDPTRERSVPAPPDRRRTDLGRTSAL